MKRIIPAVLCILAAFALSAFSYGYIEKQCDFLYACADNALENDENLFDFAKILVEKWENEKISFGALLKHSDADELQKNFLKIAVDLKNNDKTALKSDIEELEIALKVISEGEKPNINNIF